MATGRRWQIGSGSDEATREPREGRSKKITKKASKKRTDPPPNKNT
jgi:hypothetical protein